MNISKRYIAYCIADGGKFLERSGDGVGEGRNPRQTHSNNTSPRNYRNFKKESHAKICRENKKRPSGVLW